MSTLQEIEQATLAEFLFTHYGLDILEQLQHQDSLELLKRKWLLSDRQCRQQIQLAIEYIKRE